MNSNTLKIIGTCELPEALAMGTDYVIAAKISIPQISKIDLENGEYEFCHKGKIQNVELVTAAGKTLKAVAKGSKSQVLRLKILERGLDYDSTMSLLLDNLDEILTLLKT